MPNAGDPASTDTIGAEDGEDLLDLGGVEFCGAGLANVARVSSGDDTLWHGCFEDGTTNGHERAEATRAQAEQF